MTFEKISQLLKTNTTVKLLTADNAAFILSFFFKAFKQNTDGFNIDKISEKDLVSLLTDHIYSIREGTARFPKPPKQYLIDWADVGFLRRYPSKNDEYIYELTPSSENAFKWIVGIEKKEFIGTDSRLRILFDKLKELSVKTNTDKGERIHKLEKDKGEIDKEIAEIKSGKVRILDEREIKENYFLIEELANNLLYDFKEVEQNFRELDKKFRQKIITTSLQKGMVLSELFQEQDYFMEKPQGKSFIAFWEFLLSQATQADFEKIIDEVLSIPVIQEIQRESFNISGLKNTLIEAGDKTKKSTNSLLEQLRKYLEHTSFFENKKIHENITDILKIITEHPEADFSKLNLLTLNGTIKINLILAYDWEVRGYKPPQKIKFSNSNPTQGIATGDNKKLFEQFEINIPELRNNIKLALKHTSQISFIEFIKDFPIKKGVAEVVAYLEIASKERNKHVVNSTVEDSIFIINTKTKRTFNVQIPQIIFCR